MTTLREAATQALEAMEGGEDSWQLVGPAIDALKEALVEDAMQKFTDVNQELEAALAEDVATHGSAWSQNGKRIDPMSVYAEPVQEQPVCDECGKHKRDGWALYCVGCVEPLFTSKTEPVEPVAWRYVPSEVWGDPIVTQDPKTVELARQFGRPIEPLYTAPPQRLPLTDDQLDDIAVAARRGNLYDLRIAIEKAHGII